MTVTGAIFPRNSTDSSPTSTPVSRTSRERHPTPGSRRYPGSTAVDGESGLRDHWIGDDRDEARRYLLSSQHDPLAVVRWGAPRDYPTAFRILMVEDEAALCYAVWKALSWRKDLHWICTFRGCTAVRLVQEENERVDVLVIDPGLPDMRGFDLARLLRSRLPRRRVVFTSGTETCPERAGEVLELPGDAYLVKPVEPERLVFTLTTAIRAFTSGVDRVARGPCFLEIYHPGRQISELRETDAVVYVRQKPVTGLTLQELMILVALIQAKDELSEVDLLGALGRSSDPKILTSSVRTAVGRLRQKLVAIDPDAARHLVGRGREPTFYRIAETAPTSKRSWRPKR